MNKPRLLRYEDLNEDEKETAFNSHFRDFVDNIGLFENDEELGPLIHKASDKADAMQTPWFFHEYLMKYGGKEVTEFIKSQLADKWFTREWVENV